MFHPGMFENSRPDGFSVLEIVSEGEAARSFVPLKQTRLGGEIAGPLASLTLTQTFGYAREQCDETLEAVYRFPLPGDAAVTGVVVRFGGVEIVADLKARTQAETDYKQAVQTGRQAALATREAVDVFTLRVAGLQPDQDIAVQTRFVQLARAEGTEWTLRVPLTTAPRYVREDESGSRHASGQPLALMRDPGHRFALDVTFEQCSQVRSVTHALDTQDVGDGKQRVSLQDGDVLPDRDLLLAWKPVQDAFRPGLSVLLHDDAQTGCTYFMALVAPPKSPQNEPVPREVVLLVDHSGSMQGAKWAASDWAVQQFLGDLTEQDAFALGLFHNATKWFRPDQTRRGTLCAADGDAITRAIQFLKTNKDSGGTELGVALEQALNTKRAGGNPARHILIVTDAEVTDGGRLLRLADEEAGRSDHRRISVLCVDAAPNAFLANELAERGGGIARFLTSAPDQEDIATALDAVLENFAQPVFADMSVTVDRADAQASGRSVRAGQNPDESVIDLGDLPRGRAVWVAGRVKRGAEPRLNFTVRVGEREVTRSMMDVTHTPAQRPALKALFGARRVLALEYLATARYDRDELTAQLSRLGYNPNVVFGDPPKKSLYKENASNLANQMAQGIKDLIGSEALEYGLASSESAFVAVRSEAGKTIAGTVAVANALPSGWDTKKPGVPALGRSASPQMMRARQSTAPADAMFFKSVAPAPAPYDMDDAMLPDASIPAPAQDDDAMLPDIDCCMMAAPDAPAPRRDARPDEGTVYCFALAMMPDEDTPPMIVTGKSVSFAGIPDFINGEAVLYDSRRDEDKHRLPPSITLSQLKAHFADANADLNALGRDLMLLLYVDDLSTPRARVRLLDLMKQGGARPLNVQRVAGEVVRLVLTTDAANAAPLLPTLQITMK